MSKVVQHRKSCDRMCSAMSRDWPEDWLDEMTEYDGWTKNKVYEDGSGGGDMCPAHTVLVFMEWWMEMVDPDWKRFGSLWVLLPKGVSWLDVIDSRPEILIYHPRGL